MLNTVSSSAPSSPFFFGIKPSLEAVAVEANANRLAGFKLAGPARIATSGPSTLQANVEPLISLAVLELGTPQHASFPGFIISPDILKSSWIMQFWSWTGAPQLQIGKEGLERAFSVARRTVRFTGKTTSTEMTRRGVEVPLDVDEITISDGALMLAAHASSLSRDMVELAVEFEKQKLFGVAAGFPAGHSINATGSEWDGASGDGLADIEIAVDKLLAANQPYQRESIHAVITRGAQDAAKGDTTFNALPNSIGSFGRRAQIEDIRAYWDVGRVSVADAVFDPADGSPIVSMWGNTAILFIDPRLQGGLIEEWGRAHFAANFKFQGSVISAPYFDEKITSTMYPFDGYDRPEQIKGDAGFLITNVKV